MGLLHRLPRVSPTAYRRVTLVTLTSLVVVTLAGVTVRLTGSGLGCSTWPTCEPDSLTPRPEAGIHGMIELGNRLVSGLVGLTSLAAVYGAHRRQPRRGDLVSWSWQVLAWVLLNALVGRFVVEHELLPATVIVHFLLALTAIWSGVVLHHKATEHTSRDQAAEHASRDQAAEHASRDIPPGEGPHARDGGSRFSPSERLRKARHWLLAAAMVTIFVGTLVTGSGPHAGDEEAERLALDVGEVARIHGISSVVLLVMAVWVSWLAQRDRAPQPLQDRLRWLSLVLVSQAVIGYVQYFNGVPELLVAAHVLGAALAWIAVLRVWLALSEPVGLGPSDRASAVDTGGAGARDWERCPVPQPQPR